MALPSPSDILVEKSKYPYCYLVYGLYEVDYGRQHYGYVKREAPGLFSATGISINGARGAKIGMFSDKQSAVDAVVRWGRAHVTAEALAQEFEEVTAGGIRVQFLRRTDDTILAKYREDGRWVTSAWAEDGTLYRGPMTSENKAMNEQLRLVRRAPALASVDAVEPPLTCGM